MQHHSGEGRLFRRHSGIQRSGKKRLTIAGKKRGIPEEKGEEVVARERESAEPGSARPNKNLASRSKSTRSPSFRPLCLLSPKERWMHSRADGGGEGEALSR